MDITVESVNKKLANNEKLTKEETQFVMSLPPSENDANSMSAEDREDINNIQWPEDDDDKPKEKAKEQKPAENPAPADKKATEQQKEPADEDPSINTDKIERELAKPEGQENLEGLTKREKGYFWQMRRDRKARQQAEAERDAALFNLAKAKKDKPKEEDEEKEEDPLADLKKKNPEDYLTTAEVIALLEKTNKQQKKKKEKEDAAAPAAKPEQDKLTQKFLKLCDDEARRTHPQDYDAVVELTDEIITSNPNHLVKIQQAIVRGDNPALVAYDIIKSDPEFSKLITVAQARVKARQPNPAEKPAANADKETAKTAEQLQKEKEAEKAQDALERNGQKTKTTAHAGGDGSGADESGLIDGYAVNDIIKMSALKFSKLPKETRKKFLELYG